VGLAATRGLAGWRRRGGWPADGGVPLGGGDSFFFSFFFRSGAKSLPNTFDGSVTPIGASSNWSRSLELGVGVWSPTKRGLSFFVLCVPMSRTARALLCAACSSTLFRSHRNFCGGT
jgi:hypothetical protein